MDKQTLNQIMLRGNPGHLNLEKFRNITTSITSSDIYMQLISAADRMRIIFNIHWPLNSDALNQIIFYPFFKKKDVYSNFDIIIKIIRCYCNMLITALIHKENTE